MELESIIVTRVAKSEDYDPTPTPEISKMSTPTPDFLHQRQATSTWWCSPVPCTGEGRNGLSIPRGSHPRAILLRTTPLIFYPCCPMRGHIWTALLNPIDRPPTPYIFFRTSLPRPSFHPKPLHYLSHSPLILISMLLLISGDIHPNPGPIDPALSSPVKSPGETDQYNVPTVLSGYTSPALVFLPLTFVKSPLDTLGPAQCAHPPPLNPFPASHTLIPFLHPFLYLHPLTLQIPYLHSQTTTKPYLQKLISPPKQPRITPPILLITPN